MGQFVLVGSCPHVTQLAAQLSGTSSTSSSSPRPWALDCSGGAIFKSLFLLLGLRNPIGAPPCQGESRRAGAD